MANDFEETVEYNEAAGVYKPKPLVGLSSLSKEERDAFINKQVAAGKLPKKWSIGQADRLYKNKQFIDKYGLDVFKNLTDRNSELYASPEQRDEYYNHDEYATAVKEKFYNDPNYSFYESLTIEGLKDLWNSDILSPDELKEQENYLNSMRKSENTYTPKSRLMGAFINAADFDSPSGASLKDVAEGVAYERGLLRGKEKAKYEKETKQKLQQQTEKVLEGAVSYGMDDGDVDKLISSLYSKNSKKIEDLQMRENERFLKLPAVQNMVKEEVDGLYQDINDGKVTLEETHDAFKNLYDNDIREDGAGSRYYTGYKNQKELAGTGINDEIQKLAEYNVLQKLVGDSRAMQIVDTDFCNKAKENQSFLERRKNVMIGVGAKANAMMVNELFGGFLDLGHAWLDSPEKYKAYKTAENVLTRGGLHYLFNPNYWNYVDQYGTWNPYEIARINQNSGVGGNTNLYSPTGKMSAEQFIDEGFKMLGYMLPAVPITLATKKLPVNSVWAKLIPGWEISGSAASLGSAYSSGVYNDVTLKAQQALDGMLGEESQEFIQNYYERYPDFVQNYLKARGVTEDSNELVTTPLMQAAQREFYEKAKEEYFRTHPDRAEHYKEAVDRIMYDAQLGAKINNSIETARMIVAGSFWGKWTKSKLTRDVLNRGYNPIVIEGDKAAQAATRAAQRKSAIRTTVLSGGIDNWLDDITAGIGKGLGLGDYNNYLGSVYGPNAALEGGRFSANIVDGMLYGMQGMEEAFYDPQTWIDGAIGAAGTFLGTRVNAITLLRDIFKREGAFSKEGTDAQKEWKALSAWQAIDRYISNGITTSAADADRKYTATEEYAQKEITERLLPMYRKYIQEAGNFINENIDFNEIADNILAGKDIKQIGMLKSAIRMLDAYKDPTLSQIPEIQKFVEFLQRGKDGNFTNADIQQYLNDPSNIKTKNAVDADGNSIAERLAAEAMQKNVNNFLKISDSYSKLKENISKDSYFSLLSDEGKTQIAVQLTLRDLWKERLESMQETLNTKGTENASHSYEAEFGSEKGRTNVIESLNNLISEYTKRRDHYEALVIDKIDKFNKAATPEEKQQATKDLIDSQYARDYYIRVIEETNQLLKQKSKAQVQFDESGNARTLSAEEIMKLSPKQRAQMLDPANLTNYSEEQRTVIKNLIDNLKNYIGEDGKTQNLYQVVMDAGKMQDRLDASNLSIKEVVKNPGMLRNYIGRVKERQSAAVAQAIETQLKEEQNQKLDSITTPEEAINVILRGKSDKDTIDRGFYIPSQRVKEYIENHPEKAEILTEAQKMVQALEDFYTSADSILGTKDSGGIKRSFASAVNQANSLEEAMSAAEDLLDAQTDVTAKLQLDRILEKMKSLGYQRDATKVRNREEEQKRKIEEETKRIQAEEAKKDGKNYDWEGYKVEDTVYNKRSGTAGKVVGFEKGTDGTNKMLVEVTDKLGRTRVFKYDSITSKDKVTKEKPSAKVEETPIEEAPTPANSETPVAGYEQTWTSEEIVIEVDSEGKVESPSAEKQAAAENTPVISVPTHDTTDQGNNIQEDTSTTMSGNRWVEYSISNLENGIVKEEVPESPNTLFGKFREWLTNNKIKLQEIIDKEFGRMFVDNPNIEIRFMKIKPTTDLGKALQNVIFNVVELTPELRKKYHDESRGGVIQANGKTWLIVGTTGFEREAPIEQRKAYDTMKKPINDRRDAYFANNPDEVYYVDLVAHTEVQSTTSGRVVNQALGSEAPRLKRVSELLKSAGRTLKQAAFGIQTAQVGEKSFTTTKNIKDRSRVFPPRNVEDNRGRVFILIDTPNGNQIPAMIEPAMYNEIADGTPLKEWIQSTLASLMSTSYETREKAIKELCGYLVLDENKNILIGTKDSNVITIKRKGLPDITQKLGENFDIGKFFKDIENANFQINITLKTLEDPVMLKMYDDSGALMTTVDSMETVGMSYSVYMTDTSGKPIILTPVGNAIPGTGTSEFKKYTSVRVGNTTYEFKNGQWVNRYNGNKVNPGTELERSCIYNRKIQEGNWTPFATKEGLEYYNNEGTVISRDGLGNVKILNAEESAALNDAIQQMLEQEKRLKNVEDVVIDESPAPIPSQQEAPTLTQDQINQQAVGNFEAPAAPPVTPVETKEVIKETKETQSSQPKEVISDVGKKSLTDLQKTEKLSTFDAIARSTEYRNSLYEVLRKKGWGITGKFSVDAEILKSHNISIVGINNVEDWINFIRDCR